MSYALPARRKRNRAHRRYPVDLPVRFTQQTDQRAIVMHAGSTHNVSRKGLCVYSEYLEEVGTELMLELGMDGTEVLVSGRVVWISEHGERGPEMGIELTGSGIDSALFDWVLETGF